MKLINSLLLELTQKAFIGKDQENMFKVISSEPRYSALCVLIGDFQDKEGVISTKVNKAFKVFAWILMFLPIILVEVTLPYKEIDYPIRFIVPI